MTQLRTRIVALAAAVAAVPALLSPLALAQEAAPTVRPQQSPEGALTEPLSDTPQSKAGAGVGDAYSFTAGTTVTTAYFFRGYNQEDQGVIVQPFAELGISLFNNTVVDDDTQTRYVVDADGTRRAVVVNDDARLKYTLDATAGIWNSVHSEKTGSRGSGPSNWYESDQYAGLKFKTGDLSLGVLYTFYTYPNGAFDTIGEVSFSGGYSIPLSKKAEGNSGADVSLDLGIIAAFETFDGNGSDDAYGEVDLAPKLAFETGGTDLTLSFPFAVGLSLKDYYVDASGSDEFFGYFSVAAVLGVPIPVPANYGTWELRGGFQFIYLNADALKVVNSGGDDYKLVGSVALQISF